MFQLHKFRYSAGYATDTTEHDSREHAIDHAKNLGIGSYRLSHNGKTVDTFQVVDAYDGRFIITHY